NSLFLALLRCGHRHLVGGNLCAQGCGGAPPLPTGNSPVGRATIVGGRRARRRCPCGASAHNGPAPPSWA
ncbi:unnamed protein product, partial [Musa textilis]